MTASKHLCYNSLHERPESGGPCPHCGFDLAEYEKKFPVALRAGTVLNRRYIVGRILGQGGFGITYLAWDSKLETWVAAKEFMPNEIATRIGTTVSVAMESRTEDLTYGAQRLQPEAWFQSAVEFLEAIESQRVAEVPGAASAAPAAPAKKKSRTVLFAGIAAIVVLLAVGIGYFAVGGTGTDNGGVSLLPGSTVTIAGENYRTDATILDFHGKSPTDGDFCPWAKFPACGGAAEQAQRSPLCLLLSSNCTSVFAIP